MTPERTPARRRRGEHVAIRHLWRGDVRFATGAIVVDDAEELTVLWVPPGAPVWAPAVPGQGRRYRTALLRSLLEPVGSLAEREWFGGGALHLIRSEVAHAIVAMWTAAGELAGWYVNLQAPVRRSPTGFDTMDQVLDLVVLPDLTTWWWKDEDELELAVELGVFTREEAGAIRSEGERVAALIDSGTPPFDPAWADWTPDPAWGRPELPDGWQSPDRRGNPGP